jgi:hypothetical protein
VRDALDWILGLSLYEAMQSKEIQMTTDSELEDIAAMDACTVVGYDGEPTHDMFGYHCFIKGARYAAEKSAYWKSEYDNLCKFTTDYEQQRNQLRAENEKKASRISELEVSLNEILNNNPDLVSGTQWAAKRERAKKLLSPKDTQGVK